MARPIEKSVVVVKPKVFHFENCTLFPGRSLLVVACLFITLRCMGAAPPRVDPPQLPPWTDPGAMFERLVGKEGEVDEKVLGEVEVSAKEERQIGKKMVEAYLANLRRQRLRFVTRGKDVEYLEQLVEVMHPLMDNGTRYPSIRVYLVLASRCDARSFPGGHLVFFQGLLESADNEAALIGIVGHELSHLDRGHHTRRIKQVKLAERTFSGRGGAMPMERFFAVGGVMMRAWLRPFRADYEREADVDGARWSYEAGYDCREMAKLFLKVHERSGNPEVPVPEFFRSHPAASDRHRAIMEQYERLQADSPAAHLHIGEDNLRRRAVRRP
jgi:predicted Zn-dependent protease